jgi:hypothetical protein
MDGMARLVEQWERAGCVLSRRLVTSAVTDKLLGNRRFPQSDFRMPVLGKRAEPGSMLRATER